MSNKKAFGFIKGYSFLFEDEGNKIEAWFSAFSGLEKVYIYGNLISSQRNLSTNSSNSFNIGSNKYSTNLKAENIFKGPFVCTLSKNGAEYKRQKLVFPQSKPGKFPFLVRFIFFILLGGIFGFASGYWQLPKVITYIFLSVIFLVVYFYAYRRNKDLKPKIEDEEII